ncbi:Mitochondrial import inner membrane translocase subunit [Arachis hypogaea]|nr:Mitochondrial import inner membrane translocase subunit [Arachis hypogaea]
MTFAVLSGVHSLVVCILKRLGGKDDGMRGNFFSCKCHSCFANLLLLTTLNFISAIINAGVAGCCTGLALGFSGAPLLYYGRAKQAATSTCDSNLPENKFATQYTPAPRTPPSVPSSR